MPPRKSVSVADVVEEMLQSVKASPKKQRKLLSSTFWRRFGIVRRRTDNANIVRSMLTGKGLWVNPDNFGMEDKNEWIILTYVETKPEGLSGETPVDIKLPFPSDEWFDRISRQEFESEREVEIWFVVPLLEALGYKEPDIAIGFRVTMYEGTTKVNKEADCVCFNGCDHIPTNALLVAEAKRFGNAITADNVGQAKAYAMWLPTPYYLVTNGDQLRLYLFRGASQTDIQLLHCDRSTLKDNWAQLYQYIAKSAVIEYKEKLQATFPQWPHTG